MRKRKLLQLIIPALIIYPIVMWLGWFFTPKKKLVVAIVDKTVLNTDAQEHTSLWWILNHNRFTKTATQSYKNSRDHFGFFPKDDEKFKLKGLERFSSEQLKQLSNDADLAYFTDTYGIYRNEWYSQKQSTERSNLIYGGMSAQDIEFLQDMK